MFGASLGGVCFLMFIYHSIPAGSPGGSELLARDGCSGGALAKAGWQKWHLGLCHNSGVKEFFFFF